MTPNQHDELLKELASTKTLVLDMHHRLFGNGQPGFVASMDTRVKTLENTKSKGQGAIWAVTVLLAIAQAAYWISSKIKLTN